MRDPLTGLGDHAAFNAALARAEGREDVVIVLIGVDPAQTADRRRACQASERALRAVAAGVSAALRSGDELFRVGRDRFAALVAVADPREAHDVARRLRASAGATGLSVGVATAEPGDSGPAVLARAALALGASRRPRREGVA
ncbi:MAG TPA: diguanylate cyclase [Solirubrobacteraceae bacterium]|jgi:GGDEF domain-containing protein